MKLKWFLFLFSMFYVTNFFSLSNIEILNNQAETLEEFPDPDNEDILNPTYLSFYKKNKKTTFQEFKQYISDLFTTKKEDDFFTIKNFKKLIKKEIKKGSDNQFTGDFIRKLSIEKEPTIIIWGSIRGAFHSLVRTLNQLIELKYIDKNLKATNNNIFFIFNGNTISPSPYSIETLQTILLFVSQNRNQTFFIKGYDESLKIGTAQDFYDKELSNSIIKFFSTLPLALYLRLDPENIVRISSFDLSNDLLNEENFSLFLSQENINTIDTLNLKNILKSKEKINLKGFITNKQDLTYNYPPYSGIDFNLLDNKTAVWQILSCPTRPFKIAYDFFYDNFVVLQTKKDLKSWQITAYNQDIRNQTGFNSKCYDFFTGEKYLKETVLTKIEEKKQEEVIEKKVTPEIKPTPIVEKKIEIETPIKIGTTLDLSGPVSDICKNISIGLSAGINKINSEGGINGRKITLKTLDDKFEPDLARKNIETFLAENIDIIMNPAGSYLINKGYLDLVKNEKILVFLPDIQLPELRTKDLKNICYFCPSIDKETEYLLNYLIKEQKSKKFIIFYEKEPYGQTALKSALSILNKEKNNNDLLWLEIEQQIGVVKIDDIVAKIKKFNPDTLLFLSLPSVIQSLLQALSFDYLKNKTIAGISALNSSKIKNFLQNQKLKYLITRLTPPIENENLEIIKQYDQAIKTSNYEKNMYSLEGFISASIFGEICKKIEGDITKEKIIKELEKIKNYNFKGLILDFDSEKRELFHKFWICNEKDLCHEIDLSKEIKPEKEIPKEIEKKETKIESEKPKDLEKPKDIENQKEIKIGNSLDSSTTFKNIVAQILGGINLYLDKIKKAGGIKDKRIQFTHLDDKLSVETTRENLNKLIESGSDILICSGESKVFGEYLPFIKDKKLLCLFPSANSPDFRLPDLKYLIHLLAPSNKEGYALIDFAINNLKLKKIAITCPDEPASLGALEQTKQILIKNNLKENENWIILTHPVNLTNVADISKKIKDFKADGIILYSYAYTAKMILDKLGADFIYNKSIFCSSMEPATEKALKEKGVKIINVSLLPNPKDSQAEIVKEYIQDCLRTKTTQDPYSLQGYVSTAILEYALNNIDHPVTKDKIVDFLENIKNYNFKGLKLNFNSKTRTLLNSVWVNDGTQTVEKEIDHD